MQLASDAMVLCYGVARRHSAAVRGQCGCIDDVLVCPAALQILREQVGVQRERLISCSISEILGASTNVMFWI